MPLDFIRERPSLTLLVLSILLSVDDVSVDGDGDDAPGDELATCL